MTITNTNGKFLTEGNYTFKISAYPSQVSAGQYLKWQFEFALEGYEKPIKMSFFDNQMGDLLRAVGCKEIKRGVFDWETEKVYGKSFNADLFFEEDRNGKINDKTGKVQTYRKLKNFTPAGEQKEEVPNPEDLQWEN